MKNLLFSALLLMTIATPISARQQIWVPVGDSDMRWAFFKLYNVTLLTDDGTYASDDYPQALEIVYYRNIDRHDLINATRDQWQQLGIPENRFQPWLATLAELWPDIRKHDTLRLEVDASGANRFLHNGQAIGSVDDPDFSMSFLAIWLSVDTSRPDIRHKLIGGHAGNG
ncbi:chalcone isomerase family protein [Granulosicoccus sp. 3-233]|uniref:chalcone isomerase family protein n=1 Tax=Granulosicoccus sp. 3-233 TaxID=3417969 RepID=UPI003D34A7BE